jgi:hypothetical protein
VVNCGETLQVLKGEVHNLGPGQVDFSGHFDVGFRQNTKQESLPRRLRDERADADPADFAELDSSADSRAEVLERRLMQQMQERAREQRQAMEAMREQQARLEEKMERQAKESNKRLDRLITIVSAMQAQQQQAETD